MLIIMVIGEAEIVATTWLVFTILWILAAATRESWIRRTKSWLLRTKTTVWTPSTKCWCWRKPLNNCEKLKSFPDVTWILNSVLVEPLHLVAIIGHPYNGEPWETSVFHRFHNETSLTKHLSCILQLWLGNSLSKSPDNEKLTSNLFLIYQISNTKQ